MAFRADYLARETGQNLVRNPLLTLASVLTVSVSLALLAGVLLLGYGINNAFKQWNDDVTFIVYMNPTAPQDQIDSLGRELKGNPQVASITYFDKDASLAEFLRLFPDQPTITDTVQAEDLPTSFRVKPKNPNAAVVKQVADSFEAKPGVLKVEFVADAVRLVQGASSKLRRFALIGAIGLLMASAALIFTTIQTAVFARRREIEVMKLVGATNWFIRLPFIFEGLIQGLAGASVASVLAWVFQLRWFASFGGSKGETLFDTILWLAADFRGTIGLLFLIGAGVGAIGSATSVTWYLRD